MTKISIVTRRAEQEALSAFSHAELRALKREDEGACQFEGMPAGNLPLSELGYPSSAGSLEIGVPLLSTEAGEVVSFFEEGRARWQATLEKEPRKLILKFEKVKESFDRERMLTSSEVSEMLSVSLQTIYRLVKAGNLRACRVGRLLRFEFPKVLDFLSGGVQETPSGALRGAQSASGGEGQSPCITSTGD